MEEDYKEQLRMMTEGLGEWMDRRERKRRRWRIAGGVGVVALLVVVQIFFPWRRKEVVVQKEVYYVSENGEVNTERLAHQPKVDSSYTVQPQRKKERVGTKLQATASQVGDTGWQYINYEGDGDEKATIRIGSNGMLINSEDNGEKATVEIGVNGLRINSVDRSGHQEKVNITIDGTGLEWSDIKDKYLEAQKRTEERAAAAKNRAEERAKYNHGIIIIDSNSMNQYSDEE